MDWVFLVSVFGVPLHCSGESHSWQGFVGMQCTITARPIIKNLFGQIVCRVSPKVPRPFLRAYRTAEQGSGRTGTAGEALPAPFFSARAAPRHNAEESVLAQNDLPAAVQVFLP